MTARTWSSDIHTDLSPSFWVIPNKLARWEDAWLKNGKPLFSTYDYPLWECTKNRTLFFSALYILKLDSCQIWISSGHKRRHGNMLTMFAFYCTPRYIFQCVWFVSGSWCLFYLINIYRYICSCVCFPSLYVIFSN